MLKFKVFKPLLNRVMIAKTKESNKTKSGLILEKAPTMSYGKVVAVGDGVFQNGVKVPMSLRIGQTVMLPEYGGSVFKLAD